MSCPHPDIQQFDEFRCCLSCGNVLFEDAPKTADTSRIWKPSTYQYRNLDYRHGEQIRLVYLFPGRTDEGLVCDIVHVDLRDNPVYEAVSYTWSTITGDASLSQSIACQGKSIAITRNCEAALICLRRRGLVRILWVDAICINQTDVMERNHQVELMAMIYSSASQVVAFLSGQPAATVHANTDIVDFLNSNTASDFVATEEHNEKGTISTFLRHPYFSRVWILQEISLAKLVTLIIDGQAVHWTASTIQKLLSECRRLVIEPPSALRWVPACRPEEEDFLDVLQRGRNCSATDPKDKVFALLGLVHQSFRDAIQVSYESSTTQLFVKVAAYLIVVHKRLDILKYVYYQHLNVSRIPSWVPDWTAKSTNDPLPTQFTPSQTHYLATTRFTSPQTDFQSMDVQGIVAQHTEEMPDIPRDGFQICDRHSKSSLTSAQDREFVLDNWSTLPCLRLHAHYLDTVVESDLLIEIVSEDYVPSMDDEGLPAYMTLPFAGSLCCHSCCQSHACKGGCSDKQFQHTQLKDFRQKAFSSDGEKAAFTTRQSVGFRRYDGDIDFKALQACDTIWAVPGVDVPLILREEAEHYVLIGECYLHRALLDHICPTCGGNAGPWSMRTEMIDVW